MNGHQQSACGTVGEAEPSSERRYQEMLGAGLDLLDQGVTVFDAELRMVAWNTAFLRLLDFPEGLARPGVSFEAFIRYNAERGDYGPGDPAQQVAERVARAKSFEPHVTERIRPNGRILSIRGFPLPHQGFITVYTDVTDQRHAAEQIARHQAELEEHIESRTEALTRANEELTAAIESNKAITQALRRSEQRLREITDAIPAAVAYFDREWAYRYANKGYAEWFGWSADQVEGRKIQDVVGQEVFEVVQPYVARALAGERVTYEYQLTGRDGNPARARSTLVPDIAPDGTVLGGYVHSVDVTEQRRTQAALAQAQKMEAIGQLTGGLAHDFNNMLTVVIGNLVALKENHPDDPLTENTVEPAMHAANRGTELIRRLLTFARRQPLEPKPVEVNELILGMSKLIRRSLPSTIAVSTASREPCLVAMVDAHQLENALLNLALNARDAMPNGGELRIESSLEHLNIHAQRPILKSPRATTSRSPSPTTAWVWTAAPWRGSSSPSSPPSSSAWAAALGCPWCMASPSNRGVACASAVARPGAPRWPCFCHGSRRPSRKPPCRPAARWTPPTWPASWCCWPRMMPMCAAWYACNWPSSAAPWSRPKTVPKPPTWSRTSRPLPWSFPTW
jgi:PAS domain S-box-containing protein